MENTTTPRPRVAHARPHNALTTATTNATHEARQFAPVLHDGRKACTSVGIAQTERGFCYTVIFTLEALEKSPAPLTGTVVHGQGSDFSLYGAIAEAADAFRKMQGIWTGNGWL